LVNPFHVLAGAIIAGCLTSPTQGQESLIDGLEGVYKFPVTSLFPDGEKLTGEDILEIVKTSNDTAYFRSVLLFGNGHTCDIWGIADVVADTLSFYSPKLNLGGQCLLKLSRTDGKIVFKDEGEGCGPASCGARGHLEGVSFEMKSRRPIRYMQRLLDSTQYHQAVDDRAASRTGMKLVNEKKASP